MKPFSADLVKDSKRLLREVVKVCADFPQRFKFILADRMYAHAMDGLLRCQEAARLGERRAVIVDIAAARSILRGKECKNSVASGTRPDRQRFFCARASMAGRATDTTPRKGEEVHRLATVLNLPATSRDCVRTAPRDFKSQLGVAMTQLPAVSPFVFESKTVRVMQRDGEPWFAITDVCKALGIANARDAASRLDADERSTVGLTDSRAGAGAQSITYTPESGLYTLILRCRSATRPGTVAHRFRKWVTGEVLPSIRKTGSYGNPAKVESYRQQARAAGLAVEGGIFNALLRGEDSPKVMAWIIAGWQLSDGSQQPPQAAAREVDRFAFTATWAQLADRISNGELGAGATTVQLIAAAEACIKRVGQREQNRLNDAARAKSTADRSAA